MHLMHLGSKHRMIFSYFTKSDFDEDAEDKGDEDYKHYG